MVRISQAAAVVALSLPVVFADVRLFVRQVPGLDPSTIPQACQGKCNLLVTTSQTTPDCFRDLACLCGSNIATGLADCVKCGYDVSPGSFNGTTPDALIKQYSDGCSAAGHPVTIGGGSGSGSTSGSAAGGASTGKPTGTATSPAGGATGTTTSGSAGSSPSPGSASAVTMNALGVVAAIAAGAAAFL